MVTQEYHLISYNNIVDNAYKLSTSAKDKFGIQISYIIPAISIDSKRGEKAFIFILKYMNEYGNKDEVLPPEQPLLPDTKICELFGTELEIFDEIVSDIDDITVKSDLMLKMKFIVDMIHIAKALNLPILLDKLYAIMAYCIQNPLLT